MTNEHSIILESGQIIRPKELKLGDILMTHNNIYPSHNIFMKDKIIEKAKVIEIINMVIEIILIMESDCVILKVFEKPYIAIPTVDIKKTLRDAEKNPLTTDCGLFA